MSEFKCKVGWCQEKPLTRQLLCRKHWTVLPGTVRRELDKILSSNDMAPTPAWNMLMVEAFSYLVSELKTNNRPPHPADVGGEYEERGSRYGVQVRLL